MATSSNFASKSEFSLEVDNIKSEIPSTDVTFTLYDSIYELYPKAKMKINDTTGLLNEYMGFINGTKIKLFYGLSKESWKNCTYRVIQNSMPEQNNSGTWGGWLDLSLVHEYFAMQKLKSKAYNSNISDIVRKLIKEYTFNSININSTLNSGIWYQPYVDDATFISEYLLPFAYSTDSNDSPFYCFIDSNNNFHFRNYKSLIQQTPIKTFYLKSKGIKDSEYSNTITDVHFAQIPVSQTKFLYNRLFYYFDKNGKYIKEENNYISKYPKLELNPLPIKANENNLTSLLNLYDSDILDEETENNNKGLRINALKNNMLLEKVIVTIPFNRDICAGQIVKLNFPDVKGGFTSGVTSLHYTGNYLVEASYQKWDGLNPITILVCGKQDVKVTNEYRNVALIINR